MIIYLHTLIARFNKRCLYYLAKLIHFDALQKALFFAPGSRAQRLINDGLRFPYSHCLFI